MSSAVRTPRLRRTLHRIGSAYRRGTYRKRLPAETEASRAISSALFDEGAYVTTLDQLGYESNAAFLSAAEKAKDRLMRTTTYQDREYLRGFRHSIPLNPSEIARSYPDLFLWGLDNSLLDTVERILGEPAAYHGVCIRRELTDGRNIDTRRWHYDHEDPRTLRILIYLTDVLEPDAGAFEYIPKNTKSPPPEDVDFLSDAEMEASVGRRYWKAVVGPAGTVCFAMVSQIPHRGRVPNTERVCASFYYTGRHPADPVLCQEFGFLSGVSHLEVSLTQRQFDCLWVSRDQFRGAIEEDR